MASQVSTNEIRGGHKVEVDGKPYTVISNEFFKPGKGQSVNRIRLRDLLSGRTIEKTFKSGEKLDVADVSEASMRMLYQEADGAVFMDEKNFEQVKIMFENIGDNKQWLLDDHLYDIIFYKGSPVTVEPPIFMEMIIKETAPGARGDTASGRVLKPAILESGAEVKIPIFVEEGEKIKIDTRTGEYVSRVN
jgi:elongation factor P